ncbi:MAG: hypothetical protein HKO71_08005 [Pseudomonadales bacterium]|nr:hypothetical protein [Pseudomonadales bacterium]
MDSTFVDRNDTRWIIDYKVTEPAPHVTVEAFFQREAKRYAAQLAHYRQLLESLDVAQASAAREPRCALYFPLLDQLLEIRSDGSIAGL